MKLPYSADSTGVGFEGRPDDPSAADSQRGDHLEIGILVDVGDRRRVAGREGLLAGLVHVGVRLAYVSFDGGVRRRCGSSTSISGQQHPLLPGNVMTFAPRYSPDGSQIVFSMMQGANSDIYVVDANGGMPRRLTTSPGIDTDPSFSPDGSRIVFESDRGGSQQLYVMNADGSQQRRISFGNAAYASPEWSPDGKLIAFTWRFGDTRRIGVISPDGTGEKQLTAGSADEGPSWAASSRELVFQRTEGGRPGIYRVSLDGSAPRKMTIPQDGSDPNWSGTMD